MLDSFVIISLIVLLVLTQLYWMKVCNGLVNRIMSRSYDEFKRADVIHEPPQRRHSEPPQDVADSLPPIF